MKSALGTDKFDCTEATVDSLIVHTTVVESVLDSFDGIQTVLDCSGWCTRPPSKSQFRTEYTEWIESNVPLCDTENGRKTRNYLADAIPNLSGVRCPVRIPTATQ